MRWIVLISLWLISFNLKSLEVGYNLYGLPHFTGPECVALGYAVPEGLRYRLGGEEYEGLKYDEALINNTVVFLNSAKAKSVEFVASKDNAETVRRYQYLQETGIQLQRITYLNEPWNEAESFANIISNLWTYLTNKPKYYENYANSVIKGAMLMDAHLRSNGIDVEICMSVPLPQNEWLRSYLKRIGKELWVDTVFINVYGKQREPDYSTKLRMWLREVMAYEWEVEAGEINGLFNHNQDRELKNTETHAVMHGMVMRILEEEGVEKGYYFTAGANDFMLSWRNNPPIYHRWEVRSLVVYDTLTKLTW